MKPIESQNPQIRLRITKRVRGKNEQVNRRVKNMMAIVNKEGKQLV
jgi:hypothetical protein